MRSTIPNPAIFPITTTERERSSRALFSMSLRGRAMKRISLGGKKGMSRGWSVGMRMGMRSGRRIEIKLDMSGDIKLVMLLR